MLLCNGDSDAGNAKGHFGKDLHEDGRHCGLRIKLNLLPEKRKRKEDLRRVESGALGKLATSN